jgi:hypothetical protein
MDYPKTIIFILLNILLISTFIVIFFFTYGDAVEKKSIIDQMSFLVDNIYNDVKIYGKNTSSFIKNKINNYTPPDTTSQDNYIKSLNKKTIQKAINAITIFIIILLVIIAFIYYNYKVELQPLFIKSLIILISVGFTEYVFLSYFGSKYISLNPNSVKLFVIENIYEKFLELN